MEVNDNLVDRIAFLAKLEFEGNEREELKTDMKRIMGFIDTLNEVNTDGIEPLVYMTDEHLQLREDQAENTLSREEALKNAPQKDSDYFKVPKVLNK